MAFTLNEKSENRVYLQYKGFKLNPLRLHLLDLLLLSGFLDLNFKHPFKVTDSTSAH